MGSPDPHHPRPPTEEHGPHASGHVHDHGDAHHHDDCEQAHGHDHGAHHHGVGHVHAPASFGRAFAIGIGLNAAFVILEAAAGFWGHSVALLADAGHNISDVLGLLVAWLASALASRSPTARFTYGLGGSSILAALFNAVFLLVAVGALSLEAIQRLSTPEPVAGGTVMAVAAAGVVVNGITAYLFASGRESDINIKAAYLHMAADALVSVGVIVAGAVILATGWLWLDPVVSLVINLVIVVGTWRLLRDSFAMAMQACPPGIDPEAVRRFLLGSQGVARMHDLHIWPMSTTQAAMTAHLFMPDGPPGDTFLTRIAGDLRKKFGIHHVTIQIETDRDTVCSLEPDHVV